MKSSIITCSFFIALLSGGPLHAQAVIGEWTIIDGVMAGQTVPPDTLAAMSLKLERITFEAKSGAVNSSGSLTNNPLVTPSQLVFKINQGSDTGREIKAIYQRLGGNLQIAFSQTAEFPTDFESSSDNKYLVLTYKSNVPPAPENKRKLTVQSQGTGTGE